MGAHSSERDNSRSNLFFDNYRERSLSIQATIIIMLTILGIIGIAVCIVLTTMDFAALPFVGTRIAAIDTTWLLGHSIAVLMLCALFTIINTWLRTYMPWKYEIRRDLIRALKANGLLPTDINTDGWGCSIQVKRFQRVAVIRFWIQYQGRSYEEMLPKINGIKTAFRGANSVEPDRADDPYVMALVIRYGEVNDE